MRVEGSGFRIEGWKYTRSSTWSVALWRPNVHIAKTVFTTARTVVLMSKTVRFGVQGRPEVVPRLVCGALAAERLLQRDVGRREPHCYMKRELNLKLSCNELDHTNPLILQVTNMQCGKLHCQKGFNLIIFSYKTVHSTPLVSTRSPPLSSHRKCS